MDHKNLFQTGTTAGLHRLEYGAALAVALGLFVAHIDQVRWIPALILFVYIDLIGYIPGAIAYRRSKDGRIPRFYYVAYNVMHSLLTQGLVAALWILIAGPEWALLVLPIHLFGDRALFGNFMKPFAVEFEPKTHPAYAAFRTQLGGAR